MENGNKVSLFQPAKNRQAYLKAGIMGFPGSGKTYTAVEIAIGLVKYIKGKCPVYALDTETGLDYLLEKFKKSDIKLEVAKTRAFSDLLDAILEAEKNASVLLIDSITHFWAEIQEAYKKAHNRVRLQFQDWGPIKSTWQKFTDAYVNSKLHIVMCGRAGDVYEFFTDDDGKKQLERTGTKMQAEKNLGYEPSLGIEMERITVGEFKKGQRNFSNRAYILKDRFDVLDGQYFDNPTFKEFLPHIERLNLGGEHLGVKTDKESTEFFNASDKDFVEEKKKRMILLEEVEGELVSAYPGTSAAEKKIKTDLVFETFGTRSWASLAEKDSKSLKQGLESIRIKIGKLKEPMEVSR